MYSHTVFCFPDFHLDSSKTEMFGWSHGRNNNKGHSGWDLAVEKIQYKQTVE